MLARAVTFTVLGQAGSLAVGFVTSVLVARWLGPSDRGLLALLASSANFGLALASIGFPLAVLFYASKPATSQGALLGSTLALAGLLAVVLVPLAFLFRGPIGDVLARGRGGGFWVVAAALVPLTLLEYTLPNQLLGRMRFGLVTLLTVASKVAAFLVAVVAMGLAGLHLVGGLAVTAAVPIVMAIGSLGYLLRSERPRFERDVLRALLRYGRRVQLGTIFQLANYRLDVIVAQFFIPLAAVGAYVMAEILAELVILLAQGFQTGLMPAIAQQETESQAFAVSTASLRQHGALAAAAIVANAAFGSAVILFLLGAGYHRALVPFLILLPGIWFLGTGAVVGGNLRALGRPGTASALTGAAVAVTVVADLVLIPFYGIVGAAIASDVAYTCLGVTSLLVLARLTRVPVRAMVTPARSDLDLCLAAARRLRHRVWPAAASS
jgi:O-antigen/teichoic acid export membrane protein